MLKRSLCATISCLSLAVACGGSDASDSSNAGQEGGSGNSSGQAGGGDVEGSGAESAGSEGTPTSSGSESSAGSEPATAGEAGADGSDTAGDGSTGAAATEGDPATGEESPAEVPVDGDPAEEPMSAEEDMTPMDMDPAAEPEMDPAMDPAAEPAMEPEVEPEVDPTPSGDTSDCRVWLATDGDDANDGSEEAPVASLQVAYDLMCPKPPDGTENGAECLGEAPRSICVKPGTYEMTERLEFKKTRMGTADNRLILQGDPSSSERPVFDFRSQERLSCGANPDNLGGFTVNAHYVTVKNLVVRGANDNCILVQGYEGLIENVLTYECADTGIQISSGGEYNNSGINNTVLNCDSHSNYDVQCDGENADGFAIKEGTGTGNAFIGCRSWNNTDDGYDLFAWTSPVRIENSWAFDQCATTQDDESDCNGFKLGGDEIAASHELEDLVAVGNSRGTGNGFTENSNPAALSCSGCVSWGNVVDVDSVSGVDTSAVSGVTVEAMAADSARNADGSLKSITEL